MDLIGLIKSAIQALTSYLELKRIAFYYDIVQKSRNNQKQLIDEIEKLRKIDTDDSNDKADILRDALAEEKRTLINLSTFYSISGKR